MSVYEGLLARGMQPHIAQAFVMNAQDESGLRTDINEVAPIVPGSRGGYGLFQWTGPRRRGLENFAAQSGKPVSDMDVQLDWLMHELGTTEAGAAKGILAAKDTPTAAVAIVNDFLRPAPKHAERRARKYGAGDVLAADTMSALGKGGDIRMTTSNGLLAQEPDMYEKATGGWLSPDRRDRLVMALQGMTLNPNQAMMATAANNIRERSADEKSQKQASRTAAWLQDKNPQLAAAVQGGMIDPRQAVQMALTPGKDNSTAMMKNFMFARENGYQGTFEDFIKNGGNGGININMPGTGQRLPAPPDGMVWSTNEDGSPVMEQYDLGGGRKGLRPVAIPIQGTKADVTASDLESGRIAAIDNAQRMIDTIDEALNDPGLATATGKSRPFSFIPGSAGRRANTRIAQLQGQTFLQAYESLEGGGQITEIEGKKAQEAMSRLNDPWIGDTDYLDALKELRGIVTNALARAKQRGGARANDLTDDELLEIYK